MFVVFFISSISFKYKLRQKHFLGRLVVICFRHLAVLLAFRFWGSTRRVRGRLLFLVLFYQDSNSGSKGPDT